MKYDVVIIGGGLSGLTAGIKLRKAGRRVLIVSFGHSLQHFGSGSFDLMGYSTDGQIVTNPLQAITTLPQEHPYKKIGIERLPVLIQQATELLADAGLTTHGDAEVNHMRISPIGALKPTWLTLDGMATFKADGTTSWRKVALLNIIGYLDMPTKFLASTLRDKGVEVDVRAFTTPALEYARKSPSEMRATHLARVIAAHDEASAIADQINHLTAGKGYDTVLLPAVLGIAEAKSAADLATMVKTPIQYLSTLPPSVPGVRITRMLADHFRNLGGTLLSGDRVIKGEFRGDQLECVFTEKLTSDRIMADHFILATGSFTSHGIQANYEGVVEPIFGLDIEAPEQVSQLINEHVFDAQPYMLCGVKTQGLHPLLNGKPVQNLQAVGAILSHNDRVSLATGEGVDLLTALHAANSILSIK